MKFKKMFSRDKISIYELAKHPELIEMAQFVAEGLNVCTKTLYFPLGKKWINCYRRKTYLVSYVGELNLRGIWVCRYERSRKIIGSVNLYNPKAVLRALKKKNDFSRELEYFLREQIKKAKELEEHAKLSKASDKRIKLSKEE